MTPGRWAALFADLEAELDAAGAAELDAEVRDRTVAELAAIHLAERLAAAAGRDLVVTTRGAGAFRGRLADAAPDWLLLADDAGRDVLVPARAVVALDGLGDDAAHLGEVARRLTLGYALRALGPATVAVTTDDGHVRTGTVTRVGADALDLAGDRGRATTIPYAALSLVRAT